jgi:hypothetical protein
LALPLSYMGVPPVPGYGTAWSVRLDDRIDQLQRLGDDLTEWVPVGTRPTGG